MRWERLFRDIESGADDDALEERDMLVAELTDEDWASTGWADLLSGRVALDVEGAGHLEGQVMGVGAEVIRLAVERHDVVVAVAAVMGAHVFGPRGMPAGRVASRLGWRHVFRAIRDDGEGVEVVRRRQAAVRGGIDVVGSDFVRLALGEASIIVPFRAIGLVRLLRE